MVVPSIPANCQGCPHLGQSLLGSCQHSELALISGGKVHQSYHKGQVIFQQGGRPGGLYCIYQGKVKVSKISPDGKEQIVRLAKEGDVLGYRSLMMGGTYSTAATALTDCVVCLVPRTDFFSIINQNPQFSQSLLRLLAQALGETEERLLHTAYKPVRERLAEALLLLYNLFRPDTDTHFSIPISRDDLAALTGTAKETASRLLSELREEGIVATQGSRITVLNLAKLTHLASLYS
ncbi:Crp/Fnr family transcriptional regulator [Hymenobacter sp. HSC-4F20]|uniref:Crp/Fnr family transcriptional regulator n=1 Tax=Hymenobacter sp. HSC-4F20 TaxID=2864135 RepID=UPI001C7370EA|nr:Crp/Fnr family transcriptional regulator [Hymenobacter sp. HSC-4F20]MBX0291512.1 Crp/Fnr family transcriptional regulator [Hymenobacter sp. HSC-4F20]